MVESSKSLYFVLPDERLRSLKEGRLYWLHHENWDMMLTLLKLS